MSLRLIHGRNSALARIASLLVVLTILAGLDLAIRALRAEAGSPLPVVATSPFTGVLLPGGDLSPEVLEDRPVPVVYRFERGDTLQRVFERLGLDRSAAWEAAQAAIRRVDPTALRAGERYTAYFAGDALTSVSWKLAEQGRFWMDRDRGGWSERIEASQRTVVRRAVRGTLEGSLESSIIEAGAPAVLAYEMADVLQWDLDFNRDLRFGDEFQIAFQESRIDGRFHKIESIEALTYRNRGRSLEAYRFGDEGLYFDAEGKPLRKQFLRSPLKFSRITSRFSPRRFHPVLKKYRPHYGVDYGAPKGTPVRVTANGVVSSAGWTKGGGKTVKIRHPNGYLTAYLHLSKFGAGVTAGARVKQGDVIGYVGSTGLATASHLDYRVQQNGTWINPLSLSAENQPAEPIPADQLASFERERERLRGWLDSAPSTPSNADDSVVAQAAPRPGASASSPAMASTD